MNFFIKILGSTPMEQIGGYIADTRSISNCLNVTYDNYVASYNKTVPSNGKLNRSRTSYKKWQKIYLK